MSHIEFVRYMSLMVIHLIGTGWSKIEICVCTPKIEGDGNLPTIPVGAKSSSPGYALGVVWDSNHHYLNPSTLQATARLWASPYTQTEYSQMVHPPGHVPPCKWGDGEIADECREVKEHERRGIKCFAWTKMVESDGGQMLKVVEGNGKAEQLTIAICSWESKINYCRLTNQLGISRENSFTPKGSDNQSSALTIADSIYVDYGKSVQRSTGDYSSAEKKLG
ncbi:hypothetical protein BDR05DRAFT_949807 [Suillus weaverae]|nr:hypothetical protein BDR05DRAFT_949807 [Suillus weaverae]